VAQERVEFLFAAQVEGQQQMQKLIASVDSLRAETEKLKSANAGLASSTETVIRNGTRYNNVADAQSKQLRQQRQGTQQLGMQFNDLATSISTGASPLQAFNQQLGQIGFAMSMMSGTAGKVGAFLAGPWGAAILVATMVLGPLISGLFDTGSAAEEAAKKAKDLEDAQRALAEAEGAVVSAQARIDEALGKNVNSYIVAQRVAISLANAEIASGKAALSAAQDRIEAAKASMMANAKMTATGRGLGPVGVLVEGFGRAREYFQDNEAEINDGIKSLTALQTKLKGVQAKMLNVQADIMTKKDPSSRKTGDSSSSKISEAQKEAEKMREAYAKEQQKAVLDFLSFTSKLGQADLSGYQKDIAEIQQKFGAMGLDDQARYAQQFNDALASADIKQINKDYEDLQKTLDEGLLPAIAEMASKPTEAMTAISTRAEEMKTSFEAIGNAVSDAFQGMLTGATSFKDGMKGIINSVISELWRLYVVQQIVGFVTKAIGGITGVSLPGRAVGGPVASNQPYMVGEKGPELFVPRGNGTIIPNHNMKGGAGAGGINITVDARGSSDPAAVRAQVQQGILEAAPAIIAAAEARTTRGLRRPRLAGVMQ
jgi:DNA repair exonuclease SbcCD ATPase subunit